MSEWHTGWTEGYASARSEAQAEIEKLRAALKPFLIEHWPEHKVYGYKMVFVTPDDLRAARALLEGKDD